MKTVINTKGITIHLEFVEAAIVTEALRLFVREWENDDHLTEYAEQARAIVDILTNE